MVLLAVDVGNSQVHIGLVRAGDIVRDWRMATHAHPTVDDLGARLAGMVTGWPVVRIAVASVVPRVTRCLIRVAERYFDVDALAVRPGLTATGMRIRVEHPTKLGADRLVNAVAARRLWPGRPVIVVDLGTATKVDVVSARGEFLGGAIAPGVITAARELDARAELGAPILGSPATAIGAGTHAALQKGAVFGAAAQVDGLVARLEDELPAEARVVATGGLAGIVGPHCIRVERIDPHLTLRGLGMIYAHNHPGLEDPAHAPSW